jgi:hypothetical protein
MSDPTLVHAEDGQAPALFILPGPRSSCPAPTPRFMRGILRWSIHPSHTRVQVCIQPLPALQLMDRSQEGSLKPVLRWQTGEKKFYAAC